MNKVIFWFTSWWRVRSTRCAQCKVIIPFGTKLCGSKWCEREDVWEQASGM